MGYEWSGLALWKHLFFSMFLWEWRIKVIAICLELNDEIQIFVEILQFLPEGQHVCFPGCFGKIPPHIVQLLEHFVLQWPAVSLCPVSRCVCVFVCVCGCVYSEGRQLKENNKKASVWLCPDIWPSIMIHRLVLYSLRRSATSVNTYIASCGCAMEKANKVLFYWVEGNNFVLLDHLPTSYPSHINVKRGLWLYVFCVWTQLFLTDRPLSCSRHSIWIF